MKDTPTTKYYWGLGLENETYLQFQESLIVSGAFIQENIGREKYSLDYTKCYQGDSLNSVLQQGFIKDKNYTVTRMMNSHSLEKLDINFQHQTIIPAQNSAQGTEETVAPTPIDNPNYLGESIMEVFLKKQPYNIQSMITQRNKTMGSVHFDGDSIEFVTKYFENRTVADSCKEIRATKKLFLDKLNASGVLKETLMYPPVNSSINQFMTKQDKLVLFNTGTYHFHITLPTLTEDSRIVDYDAFEQKHFNAIYLLQWFEPMLIATLGSPDIMAVICERNNLKEQFTFGSMRNAMSRYIGVGTYHKDMPKGKILTYKVDDFRKFLKFKAEDNIWWRDQIQATMDYDLLSEVGLDFNMEKMYQSGFEFRSLDEFPAHYLEEVLHAILLICEHSLNLPNVMWSHDSVAWNNIVFRSLQKGYRTTISQEEKQEFLEVLQINASTSGVHESILKEIESIEMLDQFFFKVLEILHNLYKDDNVCLDAMCGYKPQQAPIWDNFNKFQMEQHQAFLDN